MLNIQAENVTFYRRIISLQDIFETVEVTFKSTTYINFQDDQIMTLMGKRYLIASWHIKPNVYDFSMTLLLLPEGSDAFISTSVSSQTLATQIGKVLVGADLTLKPVTGLKVHELLIVNRSLFLRNDNKLYVFNITQDKLYIEKLSQIVPVTQLNLTGESSQSFSMLDIYDQSAYNQVFAGKSYVYGSNPLVPASFTLPLLSGSSAYPSPGYAEYSLFPEYSLFDNILVFFLMDDLEPFKFYNMSFNEPLNIYNGVYFLFKKVTYLEAGFMKNQYTVGTVRGSVWMQ